MERLRFMHVIIIWAVEYWNSYTQKQECTHLESWESKIFNSWNDISYDDYMPPLQCKFKQLICWVVECSREEWGKQNSIWGKLSLDCKSLYLILCLLQISFPISSEFTNFLTRIFHLQWVWRERGKSESMCEQEAGGIFMFHSIHFRSHNYPPTHTNYLSSNPVQIFSFNPFLIARFGFESSSSFKISRYDLCKLVLFLRLNMLVLNFLHSVTAW